MPYPHRAARRLLGILAAPVVLAGALAASSGVPAAAARCQSWTGGQPPSPSTLVNELHGIAVLSPCDVWAVGFQFSAGSDTTTLIEHWNGFSWTVVTSPNPGSRGNELLSVRAVSPTSIWAVGNYSDGVEKTLILHWDGATWKHVPSPSPGSAFNGLNGVRATSATNAWAVGFTVGGTGEQTLILHWNGSTWARVASPSPGGVNGSNLTGITATSASNAWAVGGFTTAGNVTRPLVLHWNGTAWSQVASPSPGGGGSLTAVGTTSAASAWAVGASSQAGPGQTLVLHWNGTRWARVASPSPGDSNGLTGVTAISAGDAWAVGSTVGASGSRQTLILHWDGSHWTQVTSPAPGDSSELFAVAAGSASNVWAAGTFHAQDSGQAFAVKCC